VVSSSFSNESVATSTTATVSFSSAGPVHPVITPPVTIFELLNYLVSLFPTSFSWDDHLFGSDHFTSFPLTISKARIILACFIDFRLCLNFIWVEIRVLHLTGQWKCGRLIDSRSFWLIVVNLSPRFVRSTCSESYPSSTSYPLPGSILKCLPARFFKIKQGGNISRFFNSNQSKMLQPLKCWSRVADSHGHPTVKSDYNHISFLFWFVVSSN
jgi:hypothetical protein